MQIELYAILWLTLFHVQFHAEMFWKSGYISNSILLYSNTELIKYYMLGYAYYVGKIFSCYQ